MISSTELEQQYYIADLEEALEDLWFTCGKFWDGDDSVEKLVREIQNKGTSDDDI